MPAPTTSVATAKNTVFIGDSVHTVAGLDDHETTGEQDRLSAAFVLRCERSASCGEW
jgi:hypothetical protein